MGHFPEPNKCAREYMVCDLSIKLELLKGSVSEVGLKESW